jgi:2-polyprenyl-3-methyl-5-hydroxy-6-metoxy-1,4-benzoquinol methylase
MDRAEWLQSIRAKAEILYDRVAPQYWAEFGFEIDADDPHQAFFQDFLAHVQPGERVLSAACGAGRFDGALARAGHAVLGIDQSASMLARARGHFPAEQFPQIQYQKIGLQEMDFQAEFAGAICMDAMEHISPEDYPGILRRFYQALKPGGVLYFTAEPDWDDPEGDFNESEIEASYRRARALGLPVVLGEVADRIDAALQEAEGMEFMPPELSDRAVYHFYPPVEQVRAWIRQAGFAIEIDAALGGFQHFLLKKAADGE